MTRAQRRITSPEAAARPAGDPGRSASTASSPTRPATLEGAAEDDWAMRR